MLGSYTARCLSVLTFLRYTEIDPGTPLFTHIISVLMLESKHLSPKPERPQDNHFEKTGNSAVLSLTEQLNTP